MLENKHYIPVGTGTVPRFHCLLQLLLPVSVLAYRYRTAIDLSVLQIYVCQITGTLLIPTGVLNYWYLTGTCTYGPVGYGRLPTHLVPVVMVG